MSGEHFGFILSAYAIGFVVVGGLIAWTWIDHRTQRRALARLEAASDGRRRRQH